MGRWVVALISAGSGVTGGCVLVLARSSSLVSQIVQRENRAAWFLRGSCAPINERTVRARLLIQVALLWTLALFAALALASSLINA